MVVTITLLRLWPLLTGTLHTSSLLLVIVLVHHSICGSRLRLWVHILQISGLSLDINRWSNWLNSWWQDRLERVKVCWVGGPVLLWELDVELDEEVAEVVVTVGWHTLAADHLDGTY